MLLKGTVGKYSSIKIRPVWVSEDSEVLILLVRGGIGETLVTPAAMETPIPVVAATLIAMGLTIIT